LNDSLVSKFVSALEQFSQPDQLFKVSVFSMFVYL